MTFDLEKARAETEHLRENIEEEFSCMCGVCHVCGFNPEEMKEALAEIERLRAENAGLSKAVIGIQEERDLAQAEFRAYHKAWEEQATRIQELLAELASANVELMAAGQMVVAKDARIQELEDALVEVRARSFPVWIEEPRVARDVARQQLRTEGKIGPDGVLSEAAIHKKMEELPSAPGAYRPAIREEAIRQLRTEGKIGPDASKSHLRPYEVVAADLAGRLAENRRKSWQITEERKAALKRLHGLLVIRYKYSYPDETETLRSMLQEAGQ